MIQTISWGQVQSSTLNPQRSRTASIGPVVDPLAGVVVVITGDNYYTI